MRKHILVLLAVLLLAAPLSTPSSAADYTSNGGECQPTYCAIQEAENCSTPNQTIEPECLSYGVGYCDKTINILYFYQYGCYHCEVVEYFLNDMRNRYPQINITELEVRSNQKNRDLMLWYANKTGKSSGTPFIIISNNTLVGEQEIRQNIEPLIKECATGSAECPCIHIPLNESHSASEFKIGGVFTLMSITSAGFADGINPCAFAVLIFFISYLHAVGRSKKTIIAAGASYVIAVFLTYLGLGLGILTIIRSLRIQGFIQIPVALFTLAMGLISLYDAYTTRKDPKDMMLKMPSRLRKIVDSVIRKEVKSEKLILVSIFLGILVASFELPCTGEMYLPILSMLSHEGVVVALPLLILYNIMFILPLIGVFALVYEGTNSQKVAQFVRDHTFLMKVIVGVALIALGLYLLDLNRAAINALIGKI